MVFLIFHKKCFKKSFYLNRYENIIAYDEMDDENTEDWGLNDPPYLIMARVAEMWISGELKQGIKKYFFKKNF